MRGFDEREKPRSNVRFRGIMHVHEIIIMKLEPGKS